MGVKEDFKKYVDELENKIQSSTDHKVIDKLIGKFLYLKFEFKSKDDWAESPENIKQFEDIKNDKFDKNQNARIEVLNGIAIKWRHETFTNRAVSPRLYEKIISFKGDKVDDYILKPEDCYDEIDELKKEDAEYFKQNPDADLFAPYALVSAERLDAIKKKYGYFLKDELHRPLDVISKINYKGKDTNQIFGNLNFTTNAESRQSNIFRIWLMGAKGFSYEEAVEYSDESPNFKENFDEFVKFLDDNRVKGEPELSVDEVKNHVANVVKVFINAGNKLKEFRFPDIDYSNSEEVKKHSRLIASLSGMTQDYGQELELFVNNVPSGMTYAINAVGGQEIYADAISTWENLGSIGTLLQFSYYPTNIQSARDVNSINNAFKISAINRAELKLNNNQIRGKSISEIIEGKMNSPLETCGKVILGRLMPNYIKDTKLDRAKDFLSRENDNYFEDYKTIKKTNNVSAREAVNSGLDYGNEEMINHIIAINSDYELTNALNNVFTENVSAEELKKRLNESDDGKKILDAADTALGKFVVDSIGRVELCNILGIDSLDLLLIDGKTPNEVFGPKYADIKVKGDRDLFIKAEIINCIVKGDTHLSVKKYEISPDDKLVSLGYSRLNLSKDEAVNSISYLSEVYDLHKNFVEVKKLFAKYQKDPEANFSGSKVEGSELYRDMIAALKKCIDASDINSKHTGKELREAMEEYRNAARLYHKERKGYLTGPLSKKGRIRLGLADDAINHLVERYEKLNILEVDLPKIYEDKTEIKMADLKGLASKTEMMRGNKMNKNSFDLKESKNHAVALKVENARIKAAENNKDYKNNKFYKIIEAKSPDKAMSRWSKFQRKKDGFVKESNQRLQNIIVEYGDLMNYVMGPDGKGGFKKSFNYNGDIDKAYDRLTEVVVDQLIADPNVKTFSNGAVARKDFIDELKNDVRDFLIEKNSLSDISLGMVKTLLNGQGIKKSYIMNRANKELENREARNNRKRNANKNIDDIVRNDSLGSILSK